MRIESLSDLIFGLALSIGSLELIARTPRTPEDLGMSVALFAFSFVVVVSIWVGYTRIMAVLQGEGGGAFPEPHPAVLCRSGTISVLCPPI
jgi:uncharacterized membrane protein